MNGVLGAVLWVAAALSGTALAAETYTARNGGPTPAAMLSRSNPVPAEGLAFVRPVLSGVLYRGGFHGGDRGRTGLSSGQKTALCEAGFSSARYIDFGRHANYGTTSCRTGSITYASGKSTRPADVMREIHDIIRNPGRGPMFVHCMWGVHSSGAIAAMALVQFCGWSEARAKEYWDAARNGADCSDGCHAWIDHHFDTFEFNPSLTLTAAERAAICPN
ncbi:MAG: hypothetical protein KJZ85_03775 [Rhodobacteraceae bacterium]|jgi:hypothetical protein|nr:hypothetical protein [Paracoccaceae bacterium]